MPDYSQGKIYKLECLETGKIYIGSTIQALSKRKGGHKAAFKSWKKGRPDYSSACKIIQRGTWDIFLIENYPCETKEELHAREGYWIRKTKEQNVNIQQMGMKRDEIYKCICGSVLKKSNKKDHEISQKHQKFVK